MSNYFRCINFESCKNSTSHRTGKCATCRICMCNLPGCKVEFAATKAEWRYCSDHRRLAYVKNQTPKRADRKSDRNVGCKSVG